MSCRLLFARAVAVLGVAIGLSRALEAAGQEAGRAASLTAAVSGRWACGAAVTAGQLKDPAVARLVVEQFDDLTGEFEFFPQFLQPEPGKFTFERADVVADFAREHRMGLTGHMLCWGQFTPAWMFEGADHKPLSRERALANLKAHVDGVVGHFKGRVTSWDVVNEAISDDAGEYLRDTPARRAIGDDYVERAFAFAHAADPDALLYYNDYNVEDPAKLPKTIRLIRSLRAKGLRVDAVGIQGHWLLGYPDVKVIDAALTALEGEKVKVMITELDVDVLPRGKATADLANIGTTGEDPYKDGLPPAVGAKLAARYAEIFRVLKAHAGSVTAVTLWGVDDGQSWLNGFPVKGRTNYPLLFDRKRMPKAAHAAVIEALGGAKRE